MKKQTDFLSLFDLQHCEFKFKLNYSHNFFSLMHDTSRPLPDMLVRTETYRKIAKITQNKREFRYRTYLISVITWIS